MTTMIKLETTPCGSVIVPVRSNPNGLPVRVYRAWEYLSANVEQVKALVGFGGTAFVAGRLADLEGDTRGRMPRENLPLVEGRIESQLEKLMAQGVKTLVISGANGTDLMAGTVAMRLGLQVIVVVPGNLESFFEISVTGRPGGIGGMTWVELYAHVISRATAVVELGGEVDDAGFANATRVMLEILGATQGAKFQVSVTEGAVNSGVDHTADAAQKAREGGVRTLHISTQR